MKKINISYGLVYLFNNEERQYITDSCWDGEKIIEFMFEHWNMIPKKILVYIEEVHKKEVRD